MPGLTPLSLGFGLGISSGGGGFASGDQTPGGGNDVILLETGDGLLLETGDFILLESN